MKNLVNKDVLFEITASNSLDVLENHLDILDGASNLIKAKLVILKSLGESTSDETIDEFSPEQYMDDVVKLHVSNTLKKNKGITNSGTLMTIHELTDLFGLKRGYIAHVLYQEGYLEKVSIELDGVIRVNYVPTDKLKENVSCYFDEDGQATGIRYYNGKVVEIVSDMLLESIVPEAWGTNRIANVFVYGAWLEMKKSYSLSRGAKIVKN